VRFVAPHDWNQARVKAAATCVFALLAPSVALASTAIGTGGGPFRLRVDVRGDAEAAWAGHVILIPPSGRVLPGRRLSVGDASASAVASIPFAKVVRRTPDGRFWALQSWSVLPGRAPEVRFARWHGAPPVVKLAVEGDTFVGSATFHGKPVPQFSRTFEGRRLRVYVYLEAFAAGRWRRIGGIAPRREARSGG
jgi:hypothetical protein